MKSGIITGALFFFFFLSVVKLSAQNDKMPADTSFNNPYYRNIDSEDFNADILNNLLKKQINEYRTKQKSDTLVLETILKNAADDTYYGFINHVYFKL